MSRIRSAMEIALEKTESVESNPEKIQEEAMTKEGQRLISKHLFEKAVSMDELKEALDKHSGNERRYLISGMAQAVISNISLPQDETYSQRLDEIKEIVMSLTEDNEAAEHFAQLDQFFQQFLQQLQQLRSSLEQQFAPRLRQKQQQLAQQYGSMVELTPDQDPEFIETFNKHRQQMEEQYQGPLDGFKEQVKEALIAAYSASS